MNVSKQTKEMDGVEYELAVRDESTGYFGSWFCRQCWKGGVKYDLSPTIDDALLEAERGAMVHHEAEHQPVPESLTIALDKRHQDSVLDWWARLTSEERTQFLEVATLTPEQIAVPITDHVEIDDGEPNEWHEYIVNQDVRFYFDRSNPQGNYNIVYPIMTPISNAADIEVVSHLLTNPRRRRDA